MPKATTTAKKATYQTRHTEVAGSVIAYRVRTNKAGVPVVLCSLEIPEATFLHLHATKGRMSFAQRTVEVLEAN